MTSHAVNCGLRESCVRCSLLRPRGCQAGKHKQTATAHRSADRRLHAVSTLLPVDAPCDDTVVTPSSLQANSSTSAADGESCVPSSRRQRHVGVPPPHLNFATLNVRSLRNKVDGVKDLLSDKGIGIFCLRETWHEDYDDVPLRRLRSSGFQVLDY